MNIDLVTEPDIYTPSIDDAGNYIDKVPSFNIIKKGLSCPCGFRKDKIYESYTTVAQYQKAHIKSKAHQKWLENLNKNKTNYYVECEKLKELVQNQRLIIANLENIISSKNTTIVSLTEQLIVPKNLGVADLLDIDIG